MSRLLFALTRPRLWAMVVLPVVGFLALTAATDNGAPILVLTMVQVALAANVVVAFAPSVVRIVTSTDRIDKVSTLILGVWIAWAGVLHRAGESLIWRMIGEPPWLINSDVTSGYLVLGCLGALCHVAMPDALNEDVPPRWQVQIGAVVGLATFIGLVIVYADEVGAALHGSRHNRGRGVHTGMSDRD